MMLFNNLDILLKLKFNTINSLALVDYYYFFVQKIGKLENLILTSNNKKIGFRFYLTNFKNVSEYYIDYLITEVTK